MGEGGYIGGMCEKGIPYKNMFNYVVNTVICFDF